MYYYYFMHTFSHYHNNLIVIHKSFFLFHINIKIPGIFITSDEDIFEEPNSFSKVKSIVNHIYKAMNANQYMFGNCPYSNERLMLHMSTSTKVLTCKSIEVGAPAKSTVIKPVEWKFLPKPQQWQRLDCYYEFDDVYPVIVKKSGISVKQQFQVCSLLYSYI